MGGRFITHLKRLIDIEAPLANFFDQLPRDHRAAAELAARHDDRLDEDRVLLASPVPDRPIRHALEVRHDSFRTPELARLAERAGVAVVSADSGGRWPLSTTPTTDFCYVRLHGAEELYASGYDPASLDRWTVTLAGWAEQVTDCFVYFDNDAKVRAPFDALALIDRLRRAGLS